MAEDRTFTLIGKFEDQITKNLKNINDIFNDIQKSSKQFNSDLGNVSRSIGKMTSSLEDAGRAAGKVRDTVSQIGEGVKGLDGIGESLEAAARAAGRAQDEVLGIGEAAGRANRQADDLMNTLLKAEGLSKFGDAMAQGFSNGMNVVMGTVQRGAGLTAKLFKDAMDDEMADIKAASGIQGSFALAGFKGDFRDSEKMYKKYDQVVSEMIRQSSAPTAKVVELQRYTLDTMGPLMLAAQGVKKGTAMKDIDPKKIQASATQYGQFLEKAALFSQGTGSAGFRVAAGIEGLVTRGKIDTTIDFFTDNIMLMKNLEAAGFMGRRGGGGSGKMMTATDAQRMAAMMDAFNKSMSGESTKAMASSLTGSLQGLQDTIFNPSVGILGMSVTFSKEEQKKANESIRRIQNERIAAYSRELYSVKTSEERKKQLRINIEQAEITRDQLIKDDVISTPFKAFSYAFSNIVRKLTEAINAIGPVWTNFAVAAIEVTNKVFGPLGETLGNVASDMRAKKVTQVEGFGRIVGEIFKTIGQIMGDIANMINNPDSALGKAQSEFMKGFMSAFKDPGMLESAKEGIKKGLTALIGKFFELLWTTITFEPFRPLLLLFVAGIFGPPLIGAVIAGATPLIISALGKMALGAVGLGGKGGAGVGRVGTRVGGANMFISQKNALRVARMQRGVGEALGPVVPVLKTLMGMAPGRALIRQRGAIGGAARGLAKAGRFVPGGALAFGALDAGMRMASGENAGKAIGGAAASTIGTVLGGILGQALIPVPGLGAAVGGIAGGIIGDKLFSTVTDALSGPSQTQKDAASVNKFAADTQLAASKLRSVGVDPNQVAGLPGAADPAKLYSVIKALGLANDKSVSEYAETAGNLSQLKDSTQKAKDALYTLVNSLKLTKKGEYTPSAIWAQTDVKKLQAEYLKLQGATATTSKQLDATFKAMPQATSRALMTAIGSMPMNQVEAALAEKVRNMGTPNANAFNFFSVPPGGGGMNPQAGSGGGWALGTPFGGPPTPHANGNVFTQPTFFKFASGGAFRTGLMGEAGPEAVMPLRRGPGGKLGVIATGGGDNISINAPITINQQPGQNAEQLAAMVAMELSNAIRQARSSSMYV